MKVTHWIVLGLTMALAIWFVYRTRDTQPRMETSINLNWHFTPGDPEGAPEPGFDDSGWRFVSIPHDWMIELPVDRSNPSGTAGGFYPGGTGWYRKSIDLSAYEHNKRFYLLFEGVYRNADVYFNGTLLGNHACGYSSFHYDISGLVRTDTMNVIAVRTDCSNLPVERGYSGAGIFRPVRLIVTNPLHIPVWGNNITSRIDSTGEADLNVSVEIQNDGRRAQRYEIRYDIVDPEGRLVAQGESTEFLQSGHRDTLVRQFHIEEPVLWSPDTPLLYSVNCYLMDKNEQIDHTVTRIGIRSARFDPDQGFLLNGEKLMLKGIVLHHDGGELGSAVPVASWRRRLTQLKELGVNALRLADHPHSPGLLDLCDEMGFMVINEMKDPGESDLTDFVRRDRNHPSVILWNVGNEPLEPSVAGQFILAGIDFLGESAGWPDRGNRNGLLMTNGFIKPYAWHIASIYREDPMVKLTVLDTLPADSLTKNGKREISWSGAPLVDHWNFGEETDSSDVVIFTNCKRVELHLNDKLLASLEREWFSDGVIRSKIPYEPGILIATSFFADEWGKERQISDTLRTAADPYALAMHPDRRQISASKREIVHITTSVVDSEGTVNPESRHLVNYSLDGPGRIRAIDNGDLADHSTSDSSAREVRRGKQLLILQAGNEPGDLIINASAEGLKPSKLKIKSKE